MQVLSTDHGTDHNPKWW